MSALAEWPEFQQYPTNEADRKIALFDADIKRLARYAAHKPAQYDVDSEDLAQEARLHLLRTNISDKSEAYVRKTIFNATCEARRAELRFLTRHELQSGLEAEAYRPRPASAEVDVALFDLQRFLSGLSARLEQVYEALYVRNCDQRSAAAELSITQPRVAQLHAELLKRGRAYFGATRN